MLRSYLVALTVSALTCGGIASPAPWTFTPSTAGRVLHEGGWMVEHQLGQVNASPEFSFPLQLIYRNNREQQGLFGSQWWCPQLESTVLPRGRSVVVWTMPSGGVVGLMEDPKRAGDYRSADGQWRAKVSARTTTISDAEGWRHTYTKGRLEALASPTGRVLEFFLAGDKLELVQLRDASSGAKLVLLQAAYGENGRLSGLVLNGQPHGFSYRKDGTEERLSEWVPPRGRPVAFAYDEKSGVLVKSVERRGKEPSDAVEFKTEFAQPYEGGKPKSEPNARNNPGNWWLVEDDQFVYEYGHAPKDEEQWLSEEVTLTGRNGVRQTSAFASKRGIMSGKAEGAPERKTYFYRAPGQRYDGKLRRVEEDGKLLVEFRYDRRTGLMTEQHDGSGGITFYEYDPDWRPSKHEVWEPKPIRVRKGTRRSSEVVGEYAYDDHGRLVAAKDAAGQTTRYTYNARGEMTGVTDPEGGTVVFTFDNLGRRTSVVRNGLKESVEYDAVGRVKAVTGPDGTRTEFVFDKLGQLESLSQNGKANVSYSRDESGQVVAEKDALGRERKAERDARGNLLAEHSPNGSVTRYEYDNLNRKTAQIDGNGNKISFAYDPFGRLIKQTNPLGGTLTWKYDTKGRLVERTNGEQTIRHKYDDNGRLALIDYGQSQKISYHHDAEGRIVRAASPDASFEYAHDPLGRVMAMVARQGDEAYLLRYSHNARGQRTAMTLSRQIDAVPSNGDIVGKEARYAVLQQVDYGYDAAGRLAWITTDGFPVVAYRYDDSGRVVQKVYGESTAEAAPVVANVAYDARGRLARMEFSGREVNPPLLLTYEWDAASQLTRRSWNGETQRYEYDLGGQLLTVFDDKTGRVLESYRYDKAGNMAGKSINGQRFAMSYNEANQLMEVFTLPDDADPALQAPEELERIAREVHEYSYDKAGRMLGVKNRGASTYGWLDKVTEVTQPDGSRVALVYWPDGQLAAKKVAGSAPPPAGSNLIQQVSHADKAAGSSLDETFLWDGLALLERNNTIYVSEPHASGGVPVAAHPAGRPDKITWHLNDLLGTTLATVQAGLPSFAKLTAFGQPLKLAASAPATASQPEPPAQPTLPSPQQLQQTTIK